jgi:hypothetical protein
MFGILSPLRCHEGNGTTSITIFLVQLTESLKDKRTALHSIQNDGNAFLFYYPVQCRVFLSSLTHHYLLKQTNTTKYLSKDDNVCIPTVYH